MIPNNGSTRPPSQEAGSFSGATVPVYFVIDSSKGEDQYFQCREEKEDGSWDLVFTNDIYKSTVLTTEQVLKVQDWVNEKGYSSRVFYVFRAVERIVKDESRLYRRR